MSGITDTATATFVEPGFLDVTITGTNSPIEAGETLTVSYRLQNTGGVTASDTIRLRDPDGSSVATRNHTVGAGVTTSVYTIEWATGSGDAGTGTITLAPDGNGAGDSVAVTIESGAFVIEDFEGGSLGHYSGVTSGFTITSSAIEGNYSVQTNGTGHMASSNADFYTPRDGYRYTVLFRPHALSGNSGVGFTTNVQNVGVPGEDAYWYRLYRTSGGWNRIYIYERTGGSSTIGEWTSISGTFTNGTTYRGVVDHPSGSNNMTFSMYNHSTDALLGSVSYTDATHSGGYFGWRCVGTGWRADYAIREEL